MSIIALSCARPVKIPEITSINVPEYIGSLKDDENNQSSVKGLAVVRLSSPDRKVSFRQATIVEDPDLLRIEAYSFFGKTEAVIISDGERVGLRLSNRDWEYYPVTEFDFSLFYNLIPIKINIEEISSFLLGKVPEEILRNEFRLDVDKKKGLLVFISLDGNHKLYVDHYYRKIVQAELTMQNGEKTEINYGDFIQVYPKGYFPTKLELKYMNFSIYLKYDGDIEINKKIDPEKYSIK